MSKLFNRKNAEKDAWKSSFSSTVLQEAVGLAKNKVCTKAAILWDCTSSGRIMEVTAYCNHLNIMEGAASSAQLGLSFPFLPKPRYGPKPANARNLHDSCLVRISLPHTPSQQGSFEQAVPFPVPCNDDERQHTTHIAQVEREGTTTYACNKVGSLGRLLPLQNPETSTVSPCQGLAPRLDSLNSSRPPSISSLLKRRIPRLYNVRMAA